MTDLYTKEFGTSPVDNLIGSQPVPLIPKSVTLKAAQGVLAKGTVLGVITASGLCVPVDSTAADGSKDADCILADAVDTGDVDATEDVVAVAYQSGSFRRSALIFGGTDDAADHELKLRERGIFLEDSVE